MDLLHHLGLDEGGDLLPALIIGLQVRGEEVMRIDGSVPFPVLSELDQLLYNVPLGVCLDLSHCPGLDKGGDFFPVLAMSIKALNKEAILLSGPEPPNDSFRGC